MNMQGNPLPRDEEADLVRLRDQLIQIASETGRSYGDVLKCALALCDTMLREANLHAN